MSAATATPRSRSSVSWPRSSCTAADCDALATVTCDSCSAPRCPDHVDLCDTGEHFCGFACGGSGTACKACRRERANADGLCWACWREQRIAKETR